VYDEGAQLLIATGEGRNMIYVIAGHTWEMWKAVAITKGISETHEAEMANMLSANGHFSCI
jgi:hypothetical protein